GPHKFLVPLNPKYDPIPINGNCRIVGYVKQVIMDL
nr:Cro/Cl family transcriptional regulator [Vibrio anguillarum]